MSTEHPTVYVFISGDRTIFGLTVEQDGANLPSPDTAKWMRYDLIPMTTHHIGRFVRNSDVAHVNLIMRGYHLCRASGTIVPFPQPRNSS